MRVSEPVWKLVFARIPMCLCVSHVEKGDVADNLCLEARTGLPFLTAAARMRMR